jgi:hypothetical protein
VYPTPVIAVVGLHEVENVAMSVLNPCGVKSDAISTVLTERGHRVVCSDIAHGGVDFLTMKEAPRGVECVAMNASFSLSADFVAHALDLDIRKVCVLQRLGWLECGTSTTKRKPETERRRAISAPATGTHLDVRNPIASYVQAGLERQGGQRDLEYCLVRVLRRSPWKS